MQPNSSVKIVESWSLSGPADLEHLTRGGRNGHNITRRGTNHSTLDDRLWKADDLARYIGCSVREIRNMRCAGLPAIKFRHLIRFEPEAVKTWLREQQ